MKKVVIKRMQDIDKDKLYATMLGLSWLAIIVCVILKIFGIVEFKIPDFDIDVPMTAKRIINYIFYMINSLLFTRILIKRKMSAKDYAIVFALMTPIFIIGLFDELKVLKICLEVAFYFLIGLILIKEEKWYKILLESLFLLATFTAYQLLSLFYKDLGVGIKVDSWLVEKLLFVDYYILIFLTYLTSLKGDYLYGRGFRFLANLSKRKRVKKSVCDDKELIQKKNKEQVDKGFKFFVVIVAVFQFVIVSAFCFLVNHVVLQFLFIFISFFVLRFIFKKCYHCETILGCTTLSCLVFAGATKLALPLWLSICSNILIGCLVAYAMYIMYYYIKYTNAKCITLSRQMNLETFNEMIKDANLTDLQIDILKDYYVNNMSITQIAMKKNYSTSNIKKMKKEALINLGFDL